jgi:voltage-gated potassium channel
VTGLGRVLGVVIMFSGISFTAVFTAVIASYFVEKRMREAKGMEEIKWKRHIVICGWNSHAMRIVQKLAEERSKSTPLILVNDLPEEHMANVLQTVKGGQVKYVRGDFVHEGVLMRANVKEAEVILILADTHGATAGTRPDDRTVLASFTARSMNTHIRICAEIEHEENIGHLKRANVDIIVQTGLYNPYLLVNAALNPGVTLAIQDILTWDYGHSVQQKKFPSHLVNSPYSEAFKHFREKENFLLIGVVSEEDEGMDLDDILSGDMSAIDKFIKKKFEGLENTYFTKRKRLNVRLNLPDNYTVRHNDTALVIAPEAKS